MRLPIDSKCFEEFVEKSNIFGLTRKFLKELLKNWYEDDAAHFEEDMRADFDTVIKKYKFYDSKVSFDKNYDLEMNIIDDAIC